MSFQTQISRGCSNSLPTVSVCASNLAMRRSSLVLAKTSHVQRTGCIRAERSVCSVCEATADTVMKQIQPATTPTFSGKTSGGIPNLFWRRMSFEQLRAQQNYKGLPPVEQLQFTSTADYRSGVALISRL